jgi:hypothetical protein
VNYLKEEQAKQIEINKTNLDYFFDRTFKETQAWCKRVNALCGSDFQAIRISYEENIAVNDEAFEGVGDRYNEYRHSQSNQIKIKFRNILINTSRNSKTSSVYNSDTQPKYQKTKLFNIEMNDKSFSHNTTLVNNIIQELEGEDEPWAYMDMEYFLGEHNRVTRFLDDVLLNIRKYVVGTYEENSMYIDSVMNWSDNYRMLNLLEMLDL